MRIAILEDDRTLSAHLSDALTEAGHTCRVFDRGEAILTSLPRETFDLLLLDWNLPDVSGLEVLAWVRTHSVERRIPVIFVTSRSNGTDIVEALNNGADDYIVKPIRTEEMLARVTALLRRSFPEQAGEQATFGRFDFDIVRKRLTIDGEPLTLTNKEFQLALLLLSNPNRALSRDYLMATIWNSRQDLQTRTLDAHISRIRSKLELRPERGYRLVPIYSYGYRLEIVEGDRGD